jgi:IS5 family transposase
LVLKHLKRWSYDQLEWEVRGNVVYRHFCRIGGGRVPDAKTLVRWGQLLDAAVLREVFDRIVAQARVHDVTRGRRLRVDTTVVEAPIRYPTDSGLCEDSVRVLSRAMRTIAAAGVCGPVLRNVRRSVSRRMREIAQGLRRRGDAAIAAIERPYRGLLRITGRIVRQAERTVAATRRQLPGLEVPARRAAARALAVLETMVPRARQVLRQTRARIVQRRTTSADKLVSLFEPYARIIRKGKLHRPTEFGVLVKIQETEGGIVTDIAAVAGTSDAPLLVPAVERHIAVFGRAPALLAVDRGFYSGAGEQRAQALGVHRVVMPKPGYRSAPRIGYEQQRWFRRGRAWRAGGEARIARLKHRFDMARSRYRGEHGMARTIHWAAIANNLTAVAAIGT